MDPLGELPLSSIVLVTYNKVALTLQCIESIYRHTEVPFEVIVVDNASADGTADKLRALGKEGLRVIANSDNLGFGEGCNVGAQASHGDYLVFLNNDTLVPQGWLRRLLNALHAHPGLGAVGPVTNVASNAQLLGGDYDPSAASFEAEATRCAVREAGNLSMLRRLIGFCIVLPRKAWDAVGGFDKGFGVGHYEDDDLSLRLERHGYKLAAALDVYVHHFAGSSFVGAGIDRLANVREKAFVFYKKWGNAYLDWPGLRTNLEHALHIVMSGEGSCVPVWQPGQMPFVVTCVTGTEALLARRHREDAIISYRVSDAPRSFGEALRAGMDSHRASGHLLLKSDNAWSLDELLERLRGLEAPLGDLGALVLSGPGGVEAYYVSGKALSAAGPPIGDDLAAMATEHAPRVAATGLRAIELLWDEGFADVEVPVAAALRPWKRYTARLEGAARGLFSDWRGPAAVLPSGDKTVNITMLSYNRLDFTKQAVAALPVHTEHPYRLVVVDNGSTADTVAWLKDARRRGLIDVLLLNENNLGVAVAANQGWQVFETDYYVKLDNDIVIEKHGWLGEMVRVADAIPDAGSVAYNFEPTSYPLIERDGCRVRPMTTHLGGACILIPLRAHRRVGFWCEDYFPYSEEDLDMGYRLVQAGLRHYYMDDESVGAHLPRGRATEIDGHGSYDDEDDPAYRAFKDAARQRHIARFSTLWTNQRLYKNGSKPLYVTPGRGANSPRVRAYEAVLGALRWLTKKR